MRALIAPGSAPDPGPAVPADAGLTDADLARLYEPPRSTWLRANMVSTLDGSATGADGRSGSINNATDKRVFDLLRSSADAVLVGAGTARIEGYRDIGRPLVVVSRRAEVPPRLTDRPPGAVLLLTCDAAPGLDRARDTLGGEHVLVAGRDHVDLAAAVPALHDRGLRQLLCEGGPTLLHDLLELRLVDELCLTIVPGVVAGTGPRILTGTSMYVGATLEVLLEERGTLLGRWVFSHTLG